jgi:hypothetical protein
MKKKSTPIGRAYFLPEDAVFPDLPKGQTWKFVMKLGVGVTIDVTPEGIKRFQNKTIIPMFYLIATDRESAQEALSSKFEHLFDCCENEGGI